MATAMPAVNSTVSVRSRWFGGSSGTWGNFILNERAHALDACTPCFDAVPLCIFVRSPLAETRSLAPRPPGSRTSLSSLVRGGA